MSAPSYTRNQARNHWVRSLYTKEREGNHWVRAPVYKREGKKPLDQARLRCVSLVFDGGLYYLSACFCLQGVGFYGVYAKYF